MGASILAYATGCGGVSPTRHMPTSIPASYGSVTHCARHGDADAAHDEYGFHRCCMRVSCPLTVSTGAMVAPGDVNHIGYSSCLWHRPVSAVPHAASNTSSAQSARLRSPRLPNAECARLLLRRGWRESRGVFQALRRSNRSAHAVVVHPVSAMGHATYKTGQLKMLSAAPWMGSHSGFLCGNDRGATQPQLYRQKIQTRRNCTDRASTVVLTVIS